jgi:hypothetical protein
MNRKFLLLLLFIIISSGLIAQVRSMKLGVGPEVDVNLFIPDNAQKKVSLGGGVNINYSAFPHFGVGINLGFNELNGIRDEVNFKTSSWHMKTNLIYNILPDDKINPFVSGGIGLLYFDPKYDNGKPLYNATQGIYQKWSVVIPVSVGANFFFAEEFSLNITGEYNFAMSDYLDDIKVGGGGGDNYFSCRVGLSYYFFDKFYILRERKNK